MTRQMQLKRMIKLASKPFTSVLTSIALSIYLPFSVKFASWVKKEIGSDDDLYSGFSVGVPFIMEN